MTSTAGIRGSLNCSSHRETKRPPPPIRAAAVKWDSSTSASPPPLGHPRRVSCTPPAAAEQSSAARSRAYGQARENISLPQPPARVLGAPLREPSLTLRALLPIC